MPQETKDVLTLIMALWGALLSTILAIRQYFKDRRKVKVSCSYALMRTREEPVLHCLVIKAFNDGHRPIEIQGAGLELSNNHHYSFFLHPVTKTADLPVKLHDGESVAVPFSIKVIKQVCKQQGSDVFYKSAYVTDNQGKKYKCELFDALPDKSFTRKRSWWKRLTGRW